ncbi:MAG: hypothetical protein K2Q18_08905 [Bdellovibrionales bacterium]|nr:hypothetical protein [Bdellovibrionales bacterium]
MTKKILISGFEAFDNADTNPSGDWITWMENQKIFDDKELRGIILPVTFKDGFLKLKEAYDDFQPDFVILTGLAKNRDVLTVERIGINWVDPRIPDNAGIKMSAQKINEDGPDGLFSTIDIEKIKNLVASSGVEIKTSTSAGEYVCNDLLYKTLLYTLHSSSQTTFIHIPGTSDYDGIYLALLTLINGL